MIEVVKRNFVLRCEFGSRVVEVAQRRFRWFGIALIPLCEFLVVRLLKLVGNKEDANRECDEADVNEIEQEGKPECGVRDLFVL